MVEGGSGAEDKEELVCSDEYAAGAGWVVEEEEEEEEGEEGKLGGE